MLFIKLKLTLKELYDYDEYNPSEDELEDVAKSHDPDGNEPMISSRKMKWNQDLAINNIGSKKW